MEATKMDIDYPNEDSEQQPATNVSKRPIIRMTMASSSPPLDQSTSDHMESRSTIPSTHPIKSHPYYSSASNTIGNNIQGHTPASLITHSVGSAAEVHIMSTANNSSMSMPVSPTSPDLNNVQQRGATSGPATPIPPVSPVSPQYNSAGQGVNNMQHQQQNNQAYYASPQSVTLSSTSTTSFLANQHQQHNPHSIGTQTPASPQAPGQLSQQPPSAPVQSAQSLAQQQQPQINHRMALNDAFSYLDRVKAEFANQPEVYNKFLQVMREFKANVIDANGVIVRVVQLFRGRRELILGFNAFLPKTHHIDPVVAETGELPASFISAASATSGANSSLVYPNIAPSAGSSGQTGSNGQKHNNWQQPVGRPSPLQQPQPAMMRSIPPLSNEQQASGPSSSLKKSSNAQFTRAISYVKKVKQRFSNDPEAYKTFLAALHSFHKDQRTVADVCGQVSVLFKDHPDLMDEFVQFLPESVSEQPARSRLPPMGQFSPQLPTTVPSTQPPPEQKRTKRQRQTQHNPPQHQQPQVTRTAEEVDFFERVKKHLGNRQVYSEFLKCLNMYSQNILKLNELIQLMSGFIGGSEELFGWFKRYIGYPSNTSSSSHLDQSIANNPTQFISGPHDLPQVNLNSCKRFGSYRILPSEFRLAPSSGRSELCKEVLNDEMISCPSFESEDSTFVSSKKNCYEEALFRCEDERFELDLLIDGNRATIAVLEPLSKHLQSNTLQLDSKLNGSSAMIYRKTVKRIYGEKGEEVYEALMRNPMSSLPLVLKRLKQKDEEWQRARREWQRVWREVHIRNFYRSLDHQAIDFKQSDRRSCSTKALVQEVELLAEERRRLNINSKEPLLAINLPRDPQVCKDALRVLLKTLRHSGSISFSDRKPVKSLLLRIIPKVYAFSVRTNTNDISGTDSEYSVDDPNQDINVFYCNNALFGIVRMFGFVVERLGKMQAQSEEAAGKPYFGEKVNVVAKFLDLSLEEGEDSGLVPVSNQCPFYKTLIGLLNRLVSGEVEVSHFEEQCRYMFGLDAYLCFTIDRLMHSILRQTQSLLFTSGASSNVNTATSANNNGEQFVKLLEDSVRLSEYTVRMSAEALLSPRDRLFRISKTRDILAIILIDSEASDYISATPEERWSAYVDSFIRLDVNPLYADGTGRSIFLQRCLNKSLDNPIILYNLECKICVNTYKLFYVENTEDFLYQRLGRVIGGNSNTKRGLRLRQWLDQFRD